MQSKNKLALLLVKGALEGGGITIDLEGEQSVRNAFIIGGAGTRLRLPAEGDMITLVNAVEAWINRNEARLPGHVLGSWEDEGTMHFDVVTVLAAEADDLMEDTAYVIAADRGELAYGYINSGGLYSEYPIRSWITNYQEESV